MPGFVDVRFFGGAQLQRALERLPLGIQRKAVRKGLRVGAKRIQSKAKQLAPKDTGTLRRSIKVRARKRSRREIGILVLALDNIGAAKVELGTDRQAPTPYLRPAADSEQAKAIEAIANAIREQIDVELAKVPRG